MKKSNRTTPINRASASLSTYDFDKDYSKYYWLLIPILTIIYFTYSYFSNGFYQDDEVAHYLNMRDFWTNPWIIMSNWGKPGWKIFLEIPSLLGYKPVLLVNSIITSLTAFFTIKLASELKMRNTLIAGIFFAFQPTILQLSFRSYAEVFTGFLLVLSLFFYFKNRFILSALFCGMAFTARQETALLALILAVYFIYRKEYLPIIFLGIFPFLLNLIGFLHTGDYLWVWTEMKNLSEFNLGIERSFFHYFEVYIFIAGPILFSFFLVGVVAPYFSKTDFKEFYGKEFLLYLFFFVQFLFQCYLVAKGTNPGSWRYILQTAPFASLIALIGFNQVLEIKNKKFILPSLFAIILLTLLFLSRESTGLLIVDKPEYLKLISIIVLVSGAVFFVLWNKGKSNLQFLTLTIVLMIGFTIYSERPKQQSPENIIVNQVAELYENNYKNAPEILYDHSLILFYGNVFGEEKSKFKLLNMKSLEEAPKGSLVIWDSHYSYRPEYKNDTKLETLQNNPNYKALNQLISSDRRFAVYIFEKIK
jgi:hypothetical protein